MRLSLRIEDELFARVEAKLKQAGSNPEGQTDVIIMALERFLGPAPPEIQPFEQLAQQPQKATQTIVVQADADQKTLAAQTDPTVNRWMKAYLEHDAIEEAKFQQNLRRLKQAQDTKLEFEEAKARLRHQDRRDRGPSRPGQWEEPHGVTFFFGEGA